MKSFLFATLVGLLLPIVVPTQALADCTTIPCQDPVKKKPPIAIKDKFPCTVFDKASQSHEPCPVKKKKPQTAVKDKFPCTVFDKASQSHEPCPVKKKPQTAVKDKFPCTVFDKASQSHEPCE
jgi:hypothetical protein